MVQRFSRGLFTGSSVRLPELETVAERNSNVRMFRMRTLSQGEITGGGHDFLERLRLLDFPSVVSYNESNRDLILSQAMRGGYPSGRDGTPDERHDFFHDLIREICRLDLPSVSPLKIPCCFARFTAWWVRFREKVSISRT